MQGIAREEDLLHAGVHTAVDPAVSACQMSTHTGEVLLKALARS